MEGQDKAPIIYGMEYQVSANLSQLIQGTNQREHVRGFTVVTDDMMS